MGGNGSSGARIRPGHGNLSLSGIPALLCLELWVPEANFLPHFQCLRPALRPAALFFNRVFLVLSCPVSPQSNESFRSWKSSRNPFFMLPTPPHSQGLLCYSPLSPDSFLAYHSPHVIVNMGSP